MEEIKNKPLPFNIFFLLHVNINCNLTILVDYHYDYPQVHSGNMKDI